MFILVQMASVEAKLAIIFIDFFLSSFFFRSLLILLSCNLDGLNFFTMDNIKISTNINFIFVLAKRITETQT